MHGSENAEVNKSPGLDAFARRYLVALIVVAISALTWWLLSWDYRVSKLNELLISEPLLAAYPYQFEVLSLSNGVADVSSPRSAEVSTIQFLRIIHPELRGESALAPAMMEAQDKLVHVQSQASKLISSQSDVTSIHWSLDRSWYAEHGVYLD